MFAGSHQLTVDDKGRLAVPARFRAQLAETHGLQVVITMGPRTSLEIYPAAVFNSIAEQIQNMEDREAAELLKLAFVGRAVETEIDKQGRVMLPQFLRKQARLESGVVLVGQINRLELWAEEIWDAMFSEGPNSVLPALAAAFKHLKR
jgi:MraZ protein